MAVIKPKPRIKPSGMARTVACPGSLIMQEKHPMDSDAGKEGDAAHWIGAKILKDHTDYKYYKTDPAGTFITDEMIRHAEFYANYVKSIAPVADIKVEETIKLEAIHPTECGGTPDATYFNADSRVLHIPDFKYGFGIVEAFENWQCMAYASGIMGVAEHLNNQLEIYIHIIQPRAYHPSGPVRTWHLTLEQLKPYVAIMRHRSAIALSKTPNCTPGLCCKYCTARVVCPALLESVHTILDLTKEATLLNLTQEQKGNELLILKRAKLLLDARVTGLETEVEQELKRGKPYSLWALEPGRGGTAWTKPNLEVFALGDLLGVDLRKEGKPITPNQAKDKGLNPDILKTYTKRYPGALKLKEIDKNYGKQLFGG